MEIKSLFPVLVIQNEGKHMAVVTMGNSGQTKGFTNCNTAMCGTRVKIFDVDSGKTLASYPEDHCAVEWRRDDEDAAEGDRRHPSMQD
jgi:hypothetical protein